MAGDVSRTLSEAVHGLTAGSVVFDAQAFLQDYLAWIGQIEHLAKAQHGTHTEQSSRFGETALSRWRIEDGRDLFEGHPVYQELCQLQDQVHQTAKDVVQRIQQRHEAIEKARTKEEKETFGLFDHEGTDETPLERLIKTSQAEVEAHVTQFNVECRRLFQLVNQLAQSQPNAG